MFSVCHRVCWLFLLSISNQFSFIFLVITNVDRAYSQFIDMVGGAAIFDNDGATARIVWISRRISSASDIQPQIISLTLGNLGAILPPWRLVHYYITATKQTPIICSKLV